MRHFRAELKEHGVPLTYRRLDQHAHATLTAALREDLQILLPRAMRVVQPGDWRVLEGLQQAAGAAGIPLEVLEDGHFFDTLADFARWLRGRRQPRMEHYYRQLRRATPSSWTATSPPAVPGISTPTTATPCRPPGHANYRHRRPLPQTP